MTVNSKTESNLKLRILSHDRRTTSCTIYMIKNKYGYICGGNLRVFIGATAMRSFDYPTAFRYSDAVDFLRHDIRARVAEQDINRIYLDEGDYNA